MERPADCYERLRTFEVYKENIQEGLFDRLYKNFFTSVRTNYFGLLMIKFGRRGEKGYGILFTCLSICAVYLETTGSLYTNHSVERFSYYGTGSKTIYCTKKKHAITVQILDTI